MIDRVKMLQLCAQDITENADKLLADVPYYQDCDIVIHMETKDVPTVKVLQRYIPEAIINYYNGGISWCSGKRKKL